MSQSKKHSMLEAFTNVAIGYIIAILSQMLIYPYFNVHVNLQTNLLMGLCFTIVSLIRSYMLRRAFNWYHVRSAE